MRHTSGQFHCSLFSKVRTLVNGAFTLKPIVHQHGERGSVAACVRHANTHIGVRVKPKINKL